MSTQLDVSRNWFMGTAKPPGFSRPSLGRRLLGALNAFADFVDEVHALREQCQVRGLSADD